MSRTGHTLQLPLIAWLLLQRSLLKKPAERVSEPIQNKRDTAPLKEKAASLSYEVTMKQKKRIILLLVLLFCGANPGANHRAISLIRNNLTTGRIPFRILLRGAAGKHISRFPIPMFPETDYLESLCAGC